MNPKFATTNWSLVLAAGDGDSGRARHALEDLCSAYWYPIYCLIRRQGYAPEEAADLTQGYLVQLLEKDYLGQVSPERGRFRSFLFASVKHFLSNERDRARAAKRGGGRAPVSLDWAVAEGRYRVEPTEGLTPEKLFEKRWATTVLDRTMEQLRAEAARTGFEQRFERLKGYLTGEGPAPAYGEVGEDLGMTESAVAVAIHRLRKRFGQLLREEIAETVADPGDVAGEIRYLLAVLGGE